LVPQLLDGGKKTVTYRQTLQDSFKKPAVYDSTLETSERRRISLFYRFGLP